MFVGSAIAVAHVIAHLAVSQVRGWAETTMELPMAALLMVLGLLLLGLPSASAGVLTALRRQQPTVAATGNGAG